MVIVKFGSLLDEYISVAELSLTCSEEEVSMGASGGLLPWNQARREEFFVCWSIHLTVCDEAMRGLLIVEPYFFQFIITYFNHFLKSLPKNDFYLGFWGFG